MRNPDPRIDAYLAKAAPFAQPILAHVRAIVHEACPDVQETLKWGMPSFVYAGGILCSMAAFKRHASFGFWKQSLVVGDDAVGEGMGSFGKLASIEDLPPRRQLLAYVKKAMALNEAGVKTPRARTSSTPRALPDMPADFARALADAPEAQERYDAFSQSHRREYLEWILGARREETRARRIAQAVEWLAEGKPHNWKYLAR